MNIAEIDFQQLRIKHILYKSKVRSVLYVNGGEYAASFFTTNSPVNEWFNTVGRKYRHEPGMQALLQLQQDMDNTARQLFNLYKAGKIDLAQQGLSTIEEKSQKFVSLLLELENKLKD
ncbi:histidine kinase [Adhaeribacter rhizoryzae]|uniref:Histidine kinase n=1 Tax=Adhaeribacter rhizoryzae TaxID=2607907 RepID=A0A5M6D0H7_9BACT|nr:histidine kinase [Adhaeribacter rhizoryzae]KAA5539802.1 histidine kinase [Adhaeribacter rhizoryzae]